MQNILAGLETVYALCTVGIDGNSRNLISDNFREKQRIEKLNSSNPLRKYVQFAQVFAPRTFRL